MKKLIDALQLKREYFSITIVCNTSLEEKIIDCLLLHPDVFSSILNFSYRYISCGNRYTIEFMINYAVDKSKMIFVVKDETELLIAVSMILKSHKDLVKIIIDNKSEFIKRDTIIKHINDIQNTTGIEFGLRQKSMSSSIVRSYFNDKILVCELSYKYFDDVFSVNQLSCIVAEHSIKTQHIQGDLNIVNYLMNWFRDNIRYKNNNLLSDHSAVGLIKNGTAVCQAIAAYAYLYLNNRAINTRFVIGEAKGTAGWDKHAWNMSLIGDCWTYIDYTFELSSCCQTVVKPICDFKVNHRWNEHTYGVDYSNRAKKIKELLKSSIITVIPNQKLFAINGVVVYIPDSKNVISVINGRVCVSIFDILPFMDICFNISKEHICFYVNNNKYIFSLSFLYELNHMLYVPMEILKKIGVAIEIDVSSRISLSLKKNTYL